jgi:hypothetical protein
MEHSTEFEDSFQDIETKPKKNLMKKLRIKLKKPVYQP